MWVRGGPAGAAWDRQWGPGCPRAGRLLLLRRSLTQSLLNTRGSRGGGWAVNRRDVAPGPHPKVCFPRVVGALMGHAWGLGSPELGPYRSSGNQGGFLEEACVL